MFGACIGFQVTGKLLNLCAFHEGCTVYYCLYGSIHLRLNLLILALQIHHL